MRTPCKRVSPIIIQTVPIPIYIRTIKQFFFRQTKHISLYFFTYFSIFSFTRWSLLYSLNELIPFCSDVLIPISILLYIIIYDPSTVFAANGTVVALVISYSLSNWCIKISVFNVPRAFIRPSGSITTSILYYVCVCVCSLLQGGRWNPVYTHVWFCILYAFRLKKKKKKPDIKPIPIHHDPFIITAI